jgi:heme-degrading monooxygenase HmoA
MLIHCVFCDIRPDAPRADLDAVYASFAALVGRVDGMLSFQSGPNRDYEAKSARYTEGFVVTFRDRAAHLAYDSHPEHRAAGARLCSLCTGGYDGITVYDLEVGP